MSRTDRHEGATLRPHLILTNVTKRFGSATVVDAVDLSINESRFICVLGPSGCGKTTLLRLIAGFETCGGGSIIQNGRDITALPPEARDFGIVFQSYALFPNRTIAQNISFGLEATGQPIGRRKAKTEELLALVGLREHAHKFPNEISGGQQQRVALARALALSPGLLLLDEPLSALDANVRTHLRSELRALQRRVGVTTLMVTHDREEAFSLADEIVVMNRGRIEQVGTPGDIYEKPASLFVARLLGACNALSVDMARALNLPNSLNGVTCFRPGAVLVGGEAETHSSRREAHVTSVTFLGETVRMVLGIGNQSPFEIEAETLRARLAHLPQAGERIAFAVPSGNVFALPHHGTET